MTIPIRLTPSTNPFDEIGLDAPAKSEPNPFDSIGVPTAAPADALGSIRSRAPHGGKDEHLDLAGRTFGSPSEETAGPFAEENAKAFAQGPTTGLPSTKLEHATRARIDASVTPATAPSKFVHHEDPTLGMLGKIGAAPFANPAGFIAGNLAAIPAAIATLGRPSPNGPDEQVRFGTDEPMPNGNATPASGKDKAIAAAQLASVLAAPGISSGVGAIAEPLIGAGPAALAGGVAAGAAPGAAFMPEHPLIGGIMGGLLGGAHAVGAHGAPPATEGANLAAHPDRLLGHRPAAPRASVKLDLDATAAPIEESPFAVRQNTVKQALKELGVKDAAQSAETKPPEGGTIPPVEETKATAGGTVAPSGETKPTLLDQVKQAVAEHPKSAPDIETLSGVASKNRTSGEVVSQEGFDGGHSALQGVPHSWAERQNGWEDGFLTSAGRFVDRAEGLAIARARDQLRKPGSPRLRGGGVYEGVGDRTKLEAGDLAPADPFADLAPPPDSGSDLEAARAKRGLPPIDSDIGAQNERTAGAVEQQLRHRDFPITAEHLTAHAEAKGGTITDSAAALRAAGYTVAETVEREATKSHLRRPVADPADLPARDEHGQLVESFDDQRNRMIEETQREAAARPKPEPKHSLRNLIGKSHTELRQIADEETRLDKTAVTDVFGEEGAKRYTAAQRAVNSPTGYLNDEKYEAALKTIDDLEGGLNKEQLDRLFGVNDGSLNAEELREAARWANDYAKHNTYDMPEADLYSTIGRELTTGSPEKDLSSALRLKGATEEVMRRTSAPMKDVLRTAMEERVKRGHATPSQALELLDSKLKAMQAAGVDLGGEPHEHDYSSTQVNLPQSVREAMIRHAGSVPEEHLADDGVEYTPHITVKYGLHGSNVEAVRKLLENEPPVRATLGKTSLFENDDADVLKLDVDSPDLHRLNKKIGALPNTDTHPEYIPHATLAYLKPGMGKKYAGDKRFEGHTVEIDHVTFSDRNGNKVDIPLRGARTTGLLGDGAAEVMSDNPFDDIDATNDAMAAREVRGIVGRKDVVSLPGTGSGEIPHEYMVVDAKTLRPSHNPVTFQPNPEYPKGVQGRAYHGPRGAAARQNVEMSTGRLNPTKLLDAGSGVNGPPLITPEGVVAIGNRRAMMLQRADAVAPEKMAEYREALKARAALFGLDPEKIDTVSNPVLVRRMTRASDYASVDRLRDINRISDTPGQKTKDTVSDASSRAKAMESATDALEYFTTTIGPDETIRDYLGNAAGRTFVTKLVADGVIQQQELPKYVDVATNTLTTNGKQLIEDMMMAAAVGDADVAARAPATVMRKLEHAVPVIVRASAAEGYDLRPALRSALDIMHAADAAGVSVPDFIQQQPDLLGREFSPEGQRLATFLEKAKKAEITKGFRAYAEGAAAATRQAASDDLFGHEPETPMQLANRLFGPLPKSAAVHEFRDSSASGGPRRPAIATTREFAIPKDVPVEFDTPEIRKARDAADAMPKTYKIDTAERNAWRDEQARALADGATKFERRIDLVLGLPGSGKTSTTVDHLVQEHGAVLLDSDIVKRNAPEWRDGLGAQSLHVESGRVRDEALRHAMQRGANVVFPTVGDPVYTVALAKNLLRQGYDVHTHLVDLPNATAARRVLAGWQSGERHFVDPAAILQKGEEPRRGFAALAELEGVTAHDPYSNDVPRGSAPRRIGDWRREWATKTDRDHGDREPTSERLLGEGRSGRDVGSDRHARGHEPRAEQEVEESPDRSAESGDRVSGSGVADSPEFKRWFGDSKVVDEAGKPLVVYHGTRASFDTFRPSTAQGWGTGIYFTDNRQQAAEEFGGGTGGRVIAAHLSLQHPYIDGETLVSDATLESTAAWKRVQDRFKDPSDAWHEDGRFVGDVLRELGYDGVIAKDSNSIDGKEIVAFRPEQIRTTGPGDDVHSFSTSGSAPRSRPKAQPVQPNGSVGSVASTALPDATGLEQERSSLRLRELLPSLRALFNPEGLSAAAKATAGTIRHEGAVSFHDLAVANERMREFGRRFGKLKKADAVKYWDAAERGVDTGDVIFDQGAKLLQEVTKKFTDELIALDRLKAEAAITNYIGRYWDTSANNGGKVTDFLRRVLGKRPFEGPKSWQKQRSFEFFKEGLEAGLTPATYNYVDSQLAKIAEMQRVIAAERMLRAELASGRARKVMLGKEAPIDEDGNPWVRIGDGSDPAFTVYGPPTTVVHEAFDAGVRKGLTDAIERLDNLKHTRAVSVGARKLGWAKVTGDEIASKFGSHDGVIMHELGHILDTRYPLRAKLAKNPATENELKALADLRASPTATKKFKEYVREPAEQMANALHALIHAPELMEKVAPNTKRIITDYLKSRKELAPILDIKPSLAIETGRAEQRLPGPVLAGFWYAPKASAAVWSNYLSRGWRGNPLYDAAMAPAQASTQILLGLSGFHATTIATEGMFSDLALAVDHLANGGSKVEALKSVLRAPAAPFRMSVKGRKIMQEYRAPGTHPELARVLDAMIQGGYRGTAQLEYINGDRLKKLKKAFADAVEGQSAGRRLWGAARVPLDALWAGVEIPTQFLMGRYVPWMKSAATYELTARELAKLPQTATMDDVHRVLGDVVKEMDLRFGQVTYENWFVHNAAKHLAQLVFLAPGWTFGTATLASRGVRDAALIPVRGTQAAVRQSRRFAGQEVPEGTPEPLVGKSAAYWIGAVLGTMLINAWLTRAHTGENPHGKDFFAYRDGTKDADGNPNRHRIPGYLMHDVYGYGTHPVDLFKNKLAPTLAFFERAIANKDYFGDMLYDPQASPAVKAKQLGKAAAKNLATPLSVQNFLEDRQRGEHGPTDMVRDAFGITPAKREFVRTPAQNLMADFLSRTGHTARTPDQVDSARARADVFRDYREGTRSKGDIIRLERAGELTQGQGKSMIRRAREEGLVTKFKQLSADEAEQVFAIGSAEERQLWWPWMQRKRGAERRARAFRHGVTKDNP